MLMNTKAIKEEGRKVYLETFGDNNEEAQNCFVFAVGVMKRQEGYTKSVERVDNGNTKAIDENARFFSIDAPDYVLKRHDLRLLDAYELGTLWTIVYLYNPFEQNWYYIAEREDGNHQLRILRK